MQNTARKPRIGLLPLYIELYDNFLPEKREDFNRFLFTIADAMRKRNLDVAVAPVCRLKEEFSSAVQGFEKDCLDAIVTIHLAYSPSLESASVLAKTTLPLLILDTTRTYGFGPDQSPDEIFFNHGIHGVQDLCNLLIRNNKVYQIEAGHWQKSDVLDRIAQWARAALLAAGMKKARVGRIGSSFPGMGDFVVTDELLKSSMGIEIVSSIPEVMEELTPKAEDACVLDETARDSLQYNSDKINKISLLQTVRTGIAVRRWMEKEKLTAFTMNFLDVCKSAGFATVPFMEASKAMARGLGYAGEGDILTAALTGALLRVFPDTTFTEMFCPDWEGNSIFVSHMAEMNIGIAEGCLKLIEMEYQYSEADNPVAIVGKLKGGKAVLVNLAPGPDGSFSLVICPVDVLGKPETDRFEGTVHGWIMPSMPIDAFLTQYSIAGGTHHSALVYGDVAADMDKFARLMGWRSVLIK
jgi:L-arabinose isomerase